MSTVRLISDRERYMVEHRYVLSVWFAIKPGRVMCSNCGRITSDWVMPLDGWSTYCYQHEQGWSHIPIKNDMEIFSSTPSKI